MGNPPLARSKMVVLLPFLYIKMEASAVVLDDDGYSKNKN
jgi:hypothetical protein